MKTNHILKCLVTTNIFCGSFKNKNKCFKLVGNKIKLGDYNGAKLIMRGKETLINKTKYLLREKRQRRGIKWMWIEAGLEWDDQV